MECANNRSNLAAKQIIHWVYHPLNAVIPPIIEDPRLDGRGTRSSEKYKMQSVFLTSWKVKNVFLVTIPRTYPYQNCPEN